MGIKRVFGNYKTYKILCGRSSFYKNNTSIYGAKYSEYLITNYSTNYAKKILSNSDQKLLLDHEWQAIKRCTLNFDYLSYHIQGSGTFYVNSNFDAAVNGRFSDHQIYLHSDDKVELYSPDLNRFQSEMKTILNQIWARINTQKKNNQEKEKLLKEAKEADRINSEKKAKEEWRQFLRGNVLKVSQQLYFNSNEYQLTEEANYAESFFKRCFDSELRNNRDKIVQVYNPNIGREESVSLSHLYLSTAEVLNEVKDNMVKSLSYNWKSLLSFEMYDSHSGRVPSLYDFQDEILDQSRKVKTGVRCIEFTDLSKVFQTFIRKALKI